MCSEENKLKQIIMDAACKTGINTVGISNILDYSYMENFLNNRYNNNQSCEFEEQNINKRLNAKNLFPECKSIITAGIPYGEGYKMLNPSDKGILSVSSFGTDYHKEVNILLEKLAEGINKYIDFKYIACADTSFLIDKEICKVSGIGNYGRNSLLYNENYGSFIHLGYLLTDMEIEGITIQNEEDIIQNEDICGDCNICVKSCPNDAIFNKGGINSKKCISYLTQTKNYIPLEYRENMGSQIYGCDMCQIVCPKNKKILNKNSKDDYKSLYIDLRELLIISNKDFLNKYGSMAGSWRGKNIWKRNALISIGNLKLNSLFQTVKDELQNPSTIIKIYAAWSLLKINKILARDILYKNLKYEEKDIKEEYIKLLEAI